MSARTIPHDSVRLEGELLPTLRAALSPLTIVNVRPTTPTGAYKHAVINVELANRIGVLRYARIRVQGWSVRADGSANIQEAFAVCNDVCKQLERIGGSVVDAETESGPNRILDDISGLEHAYAVVLAKIKSS